MVQIHLENLILIDIETVPAEPKFQQLSAQWQHLWEEKVTRSLPEGVSAEDYYEQRAGVMAEFSKVVCISIGYFKKESNLTLRVKSFYGHNEQDVLQQFNDMLTQMNDIHQKWIFAGHNIKEFDVPFLCRRFLANNLSIPSLLNFQNAKPWDTNIIDTFQYWRFGDYKNYTSLNLLAATLNVPSPKDDINGSQVAQVYWQENNLERIAIYCQKDVVTVANIILRFKHLSLLQHEDVVFVK